jgi:hypothetical protein
LEGSNYQVSTDIYLDVDMFSPYGVFTEDSGVDVYECIVIMIIDCGVSVTLLKLTGTSLTLRYVEGALTM